MPSSASRASRALYFQEAARDCRGELEAGAESPWSLHPTSCRVLVDAQHASSMVESLHPYLGAPENLQTARDIGLVGELLPRPRELVSRPIA